MRPGILLDRDGTIIKDYHYVGHISRVQLITGAAEAIARFNRHNIPVAIITNQSGVARGFYPEDNVADVHQYISEELARHQAHIDLFLYSPHHPSAFLKQYARDSNWHKPKPGMAWHAADILGLDLTKSIVVGDRPEDMELAATIGAHAIYLGISETTFPHVPFPSLAAAAGYIIERLTDMTQDEFPKGRYSGPISYFDNYTEELSRVSEHIQRSAIFDAVSIIVDAYNALQIVFVAGNGASASIADHFQCDHIKQVGNEDNWHPQVISLTSNTAMLTAISNDIGYVSVFSYQLNKLASQHDIFVAFSVSGNSANIIQALQYAQENNIRTVAIVACDGGRAAKLADVTIHIPTNNYGIAEDIMQTIMHCMAQYMRHARMTDAQIKSARF